MRERMAYIIVRDHHGNVVLQRELKDSGTIGRSPECALCVNDVRVSRQHCELKRWGDGWMLRDLNSSNRTFVNGKAIKEHVLQDGDRIELGSHIATFVTQKPARVRAANPVSAGLADAESSSHDGAASTWQPPGGASRDESSLFATCVVPDSGSTFSGTTVTGVRTPHDAELSGLQSPFSPAQKSPQVRWRVVIATAVAAVTLVAFWAYWG